MKTTVKKLLGLTTLAFAALASMLVTSPAEASIGTWTPIQVGQNTHCWRALNIPAVSAYYYCSSTVSPTANANFQAGLAAYSGIPVNAAGALEANNYTVQYYQSLNDFCQGVNQTCGAVWTVYGNTYGFTPQQHTSPVSYVLEAIPLQGGQYPATFPNQSIPHTMLHEAGHAWDWTMGATTEPLSQKNQGSPSPPAPIAYYGALAGDYGWLESAQTCAANSASVWNLNVQNYGANSGTGSQTDNHKPTFFCPVLGGIASPANDFSELFAEEFVVNATSQWLSNPPWESRPPGIDQYAIAGGSVPANGTLCSRLWVGYYMTYGAAPAQSYFNSYGNRCSYLNGTALNHKAGG